MNVSHAMLVALVIVLTVVLYRHASNSAEYLTVKAHDGETYQILDDYADKEKTAALFARINTKLLDFIEYLKIKYKVNNVDSPANLAEMSARQRNLYDIVSRICVNYNFEEVFETHPTGKNGTSYTVEKGQQLHMCTRDKDTLKLHNDDDIMFVAIHELAHMGNINWGHETDFWEIFKFLLHEAELANIHHSVNYASEPMNYCGLPVDYNPLYDSGCAIIY